MSGELRETPLNPTNIYGRLHRALLDRGQFMPNSFTRLLRVQGRRFGEMTLKDELNNFHRSYISVFKASQPPAHLPGSQTDTVARFDRLHDISASCPILQLSDVGHINYVMCRLGDTTPDSIIGRMLYPLSIGCSENDHLVFSFPAGAAPLRIEPAEDGLFQQILAEFEMTIH